MKNNIFNRIRFIIGGIMVVLLSLIFLSSQIAHGQSAGTIKPVNQEFEAPVVSVTFSSDGLSLVATAEDEHLDPDSWQVAVIDLVSANNQVSIDCDSAQFTRKYNQAHSSNYKISVANKAQSAWYCFKVADEFNNIGYGSHLFIYVEPIPVETPQPAPVEEPQEPIVEDPIVEDNVVNDENDDQDDKDDKDDIVIIANQTGNQILAQLQNKAGNQYFKEVTWSVLIVDNEADCVADNKALTEDAVVFQSRLISRLNYKDNGRIFCFKADLSRNDQVETYYQSIKVSGIPAPILPAVVKPTPTSTDKPKEDVKPTPVTKQIVSQPVNQEVVEDSNLKQIGYGIIILGILSIIIVIFVSRGSGSSKGLNLDVSSSLIKEPVVEDKPKPVKKTTKKTKAKTKAKSTAKTKKKKSTKK